MATDPPTHSPTTVNGRPIAEVSAKLLDDELHRDELRERYSGLLQELRIVLPGIQVLVGFLLTAPFSSRFEDLDGLGTDLYITALGLSVGATMCCVAPAVHHHAVGMRTRRARRLVWAVRLTRLGLALFAAALQVAVFSVVRFVEGGPVAAALGAVLAVMCVLMWLIVPRLTHPTASAAAAENRSGDREERRRSVD